MKHIVVTFFLMAMSCGIANAQWLKVYQTDSCACPGGYGNLAGMGFFGIDSGVVCSEGNGAVTSESLNGGLLWDIIPIDPNVANEIRVPFLGPNSSFLDVNHIWFCNGAAVCHTNNAGKTWVVDSNRDSLGYIAHCIYFVDSLVGFEGGGDSFIIFRTSDGGKNWNRALTPLTNNQSGAYGIYQIQFCTSKLGIAICGTQSVVGLILRTTDSGMTWALTTDINHVGFAQPKGLSYPDPHNAWFTDGVFLWHSSDSGLTWNHIGAQYPIGGELGSISFIDSIHGIGTASNGTSFVLGYTSDGGNNWQTTSIDSERYIGLTSFPDTNTAYAGDFDAVYKLNVRGLDVQAMPLSNSNVQIFPNPTSSSVTIASFKAGSMVHLLDVLGREVLYGTVPESGSLLLDVSLLPAGLYYVSGDGRANGAPSRMKFVKE